MHKVVLKNPESNFVVSVSSSLHLDLIPLWMETAINLSISDWLIFRDLSKAPPNYHSIKLAVIKDNGDAFKGFWRK